MRMLLVVGACLPLLSACEGMQQKVDDSRQERCNKADWAMVGERDGFENIKNAADRYQMICGDLFKPEPYSEGLKKGAVRRPTPPV